MKKLLFSAAMILASLGLDAQCMIEVYEIAPGRFDERYKGEDDDGDIFYVEVDSRDNSEAFKIYYDEYDIKGYYIWNDDSERVSVCGNAFNFGIGLGIETLGKTDDFEQALEWMLEHLMECDQSDIEWYYDE